MNTIIFIVVIVVLGGGAIGFRRWLEDLGHRKDARDAAYWHAVAEPRNRLGDARSRARQITEAKKQVTDLWGQKAKPHARDRDKSLRKIHGALAKGKEPKLHHVGMFQHANSSIRHINNMWRQSIRNLEHTMGSPSVDKKTGLSKPGIRRSIHPHVSPIPIKKKKKNGGK